MEFPEILFDLNGNPNPTRELAGGWYSLTEGVSVLISDGVPVRVCSADGEEPSCDLPGLVAEATGFWTRVLPWDAAENGSAVAELRLLREQPTHRIVTRGEGECARQEFVRLHDGSAYSVSEWTRQTDPSWEVSEEGEWTCAGNPFPGGGNGEVWVEAIEQNALVSLDNGKSFRLAESLSEAQAGRLLRAHGFVPEFRQALETIHAQAFETNHAFLCALGAQFPGLFPLVLP